MYAKLPRRKRLVAVTATFGVLFLAVTALGVWLLSPSKQPYRPGENLEGLTSDLARSLPEAYPRRTFTDATREAGIAFRHFTGMRTSQLPEDMGSGAAWGDYDGDGWLDLYVVNAVGPLTMTPEDVAASPAHNALYHNNGDGTFTEVSAQAGVDYRGWGMAAAWGDYDNDGRLDLFVSAYGHNVLYRNNSAPGSPDPVRGRLNPGQAPTFTDRTEAAGLGQHEGFWAGASWGDYDRDGWLDLYVAGYVRYEPRQGEPPSLQYDVETPAAINPSAFAAERNLLYHNNGDGTFTEVSAQAGVDNPQGRSLSAAWADFDEDGWPDLYVANDVSDNVLFRNLGDGTFEEISHRALVADYRGAMGIAVGDWNGDADYDLFITHWIAQENALFDNLRADAVKVGMPPLIQFMDVADRYGVGQIALDYVGWGTSFFDYDNDGRLDLFVVNGSTFQQSGAPHLLVPMKDQLFWNGGPEAGFFDVSAVGGAYFEAEHVGRGAAFGDYDNDGDVDVFVVNHDGPGVLLRNDGDARNGWLKVTLEGRQGNRSAVGARVRLVADGRVQVLQVGAQPSYCSQNSLTAHFGLGDASVVDTLEVIWPGGGRQVRLRVGARQTLRVVEGEEVVP